MQFPESWLRALLETKLDRASLLNALTMAGLEVEACDPVAPPFSGVVVAKVEHVERHPNADRLNVCRVNVGDGVPRQIVCGAPNVAPGLYVPCALPGAVLPGEFKISATKMRGVDSAGMLCSAKELGVADDAQGLWPLPANLQPGSDIRQAMGLDDHLITIKLTPNRADCLSIHGIARELAAVVPDAKLLPLEPVAVHPIAYIPVSAEFAHIFGYVEIQGVNAAAMTPVWMRERLERCGLRPVSALVDISNYVMLELGQPTHMFDRAALTGDLQVRWARPNESLVLLNEQQVLLDDQVVVVADQAGPQALAGVMGGLVSSVTLNTTSVLIEAAAWLPGVIAGRARRFSLNSEAAHRFERGVDPNLASQALQRVIHHVLMICGGTLVAIPQALERAPTSISMPSVMLRQAEITRRLGFGFKPDEVEAVLSALGCELVDKSQVAQAASDEAMVWTIHPPSYRFDLRLEADFIEELVRVHGYDRIPQRQPTASLAMVPQPEMRRPIHRLRHQLADMGYQEVVNFSFVAESQERDFGVGEPIRLLNPIASQYALMRSSLLGSLVANVQHQLKHRCDRGRFFEIAKTFQRTQAGVSDDQASEGIAGFDQVTRLAGLAFGLANPLQWGVPTRAVDFFDMRADVETLLGPGFTCLPLGAEGGERFSRAAFHPGRSGYCLHHGKIVGVIGELHPQLRQHYEIPANIVMFELLLSSLIASPLPLVKEIARQPVVHRDLAFMVDRHISAGALLAVLQQAAMPFVNRVQHLQLFDQFMAAGEAGVKDKSLAFRVVLQDTEKSLTDADVDAMMDVLIKAAAQTCGASLRGREP